MVYHSEQILPAEYTTSRKFGGILVFLVIHEWNLAFASFTVSSTSHNTAETKISDLINL